MFKVLFEIKIVAKSFLGLSNNPTTILPLAVFPCTIELMSVGESPKNATSAPETKAEHSNTSKRIHILSIKALSKAIKFSNKLRGSGSNS